MTTAHLKTIVAPSLLSADPLQYGAELKAIEDAGADWHHVDVMDGHFVPNLTYGPPLIRAIKKVSRIPLDVHIMVTNPDEVALDYVAAGADWLVFHIEAARHGHRLCSAIRQAGARPGIAINPGTSLESLRSLLPFVDVINVMSVNPGFGGQEFIKDSVKRVGQLHSMLKHEGLDKTVRIEVDGGVNSGNAGSLTAAGASVLVAGNFVYGSADRSAAIAALRMNSKS